MAEQGSEGCGRPGQENAGPRLGVECECSNDIALYPECCV